MAQLHVAVSIEAPEAVLDQVQRTGFIVEKSGSNWVIKVGGKRIAKYKTSVQITNSQEPKDAAS